MQKWEYAALVLMSDDSGQAEFASFSRYRPSGEQQAVGDDDIPYLEDFPRLIARMGLQGWELVGIHSQVVDGNTKGKEMWFKRLSQS
jgi:hypothetical protein